MSLILDALRKIEQERKSRRQGGIELRPEVLSYRGTPQKRANTGRLFLVAAALLLIAGVVAALLLRSENPPLESKTAAPEQLRTAAPEMPALPAPPQPAQPAPATTKADTVRPAAAARPVIHGKNDEAVGAADDNIKVSGIAWQEERSLRRAVVNGALVAEGGEVMGARILEIKENRVKFSRNGQIFEVLYPLASGGVVTP